MKNKRVVYKKRPFIIYKFLINKKIAAKWVEELLSHKLLISSLMSLCEKGKSFQSIIS